MNRVLYAGTAAAALRIAIVALALAASCHAAAPADLVGQPAPLFTGKTLDGAVVSLEELRGRVVVVDFWASWCPDCRQALPLVQAVARRFDKDPVTVLGINLDKTLSTDELIAFLNKHGITFGQIPDPSGQLKKKYAVRNIPTTFVIDRQGIVRSVHVEDNTDLEQKLGGDVAGLLKRRR